MPGPASLAHAGSSRGRGNPSCTFTGSPCVCISCQRLPHPSLEVLVPESSAALDPLSSRTEAVLVCAGPLPSADWGEQGGKCCGRALSLPSPSLPAAAAGGRSLLQMVGMLLPGTGTVTCLPCALLFPHLVMTLVCPGVWRAPCPLRAQGPPMLCREHHPPLPPGACSSDMRMGLVLYPGYLVLLSCPFPRPLPLSGHRDEESRAGMGSARAAAACGDPAFSPCGPQSQAGCWGAALVFTWLPPRLQGGMNGSSSPPPHLL